MRRRQRNGSNTGLLLLGVIGLGGLGWFLLRRRKEDSEGSADGHKNLKVGELEKIPSPQKPKTAHLGKLPGGTSEDESQPDNTVFEKAEIVVTVWNPASRYDWVRLDVKGPVEVAARTEYKLGDGKPELGFIEFNRNPLPNTFTGVQPLPEYCEADDYTACEPLVEGPTAEKTFEIDMKNDGLPKLFGMRAFERDEYLVFAEV